jgi:dodecin
LKVLQVLLKVLQVVSLSEVIVSEHHTYKKLEVVGSSQSSIEDAVQHAIAECGKTIRNMDWFEVVETRGHIVNGQVAHYQVTLKIGFRLEGS